MPRRLMLATLAILGITLAIIASYLILAARVRDPLQFRLLSAPVVVHSRTFGDTDSTPCQIELRNTSSFPVVLYYMELEHQGAARYEGEFSYIREAGVEPEALIRYPQIIIAGHETILITYHRDPFEVPAMATDKPDIRYNWIPSVLDKVEQGLEKFAPEPWSEHFPLIEVTSTLAPLDVSTVQPTSPPP